MGNVAHVISKEIEFAFRERLTNNAMQNLTRAEIHWQTTQAAL
jgi:hypothetical protein